MSLPSSVATGNRGDSMTRGLLGSILIAAGVILLIFSSAFLLGEGPAAGSELGTQAAGPGDALLADGSTLPSPAGDSSLDTIDARLLRLELLAGPVPAASGSTGAPAAPAPPQAPVAAAAAPAAPTPQPAAPAAPVAPTSVPSPVPPPPPTAPPPAPTTAPPPPPTPVPPPPPSAPSALLVGFEADILAGVNSERTAAGLAPLQLDSALVAVARERSNDMVQKNYFSHVSPSGETAFTLLDRYGIPYGWAGENLARNNYPDAESVAVAMRDWMASQGHRDNMLNVHYTAVGVGAAVDGAGMKYFTLVFTGP